MKTICRYCVLAVLGTVSILGIMAVPAEDLPPTTWLCLLVSSKLLGLAAGWSTIRLIKRWERNSSNRQSK